MILHAQPVMDLLILNVLHVINLKFFTIINVLKLALQEDLIIIINLVIFVMFLVKNVQELDQINVLNVKDN